MSQTKTEAQTMLQLTDDTHPVISYHSNKITAEITQSYTMVARIVCMNSGYQTCQIIVSGGDWLGKPAKVENNGTVVYVGSFLTVPSPLFFVHKL